VPSCKRQGLTSSAFAINPGGASMPSARLMANWTLLACTYRRDDRISDYAETGEAVRVTDVYLAMLAVDVLVSWVEQLRRIPNAPDGFDAREFVRVMLAGRGIEPLTAEKWC
jgi:hypothetical protein